MSVVKLPRVKTTADGECDARQRRYSNWKPWEHKPKRRKTDGRPSKFLMVYYLRASTTADHITAIFEKFGSILAVRRVGQVAFVTFDKLVASKTAKRALDGT